MHHLRSSHRKHHRGHLRRHSGIAGSAGIAVAQEGLEAWAVSPRIAVAEHIHPSSFLKRLQAGAVYSWETLDRDIPQRARAQPIAAGCHILYSRWRAHSGASSWSAECWAQKTVVKATRDYIAVEAVLVRLRDSSVVASAAGNFEVGGVVDLVQGFQHAQNHACSCRADQNLLLSRVVVLDFAAVVGPSFPFLFPAAAPVAFPGDRHFVRWT